MKNRIRSAWIFPFSVSLAVAVICGGATREGNARDLSTYSVLAGHPCEPASQGKTTICHFSADSEKGQKLCVDNSSVGTHLENHAGDYVGECQPQPPPRSTCGQVRVKQLHGQEFLGNSRLAKIDNIGLVLGATNGILGKVPCMHIESGERHQCLFANLSGDWLEGEDGFYARTGQRISLLGLLDGDYVVAAEVSNNGTVPCVAPSGHDSAGTPFGTELAGACSVETMNAASNIVGDLLLNYATLEVCTSSNPHPDGATLTRMLGTSFCYNGQGAALNDRHGTERDPTGRYYPGEERCHVVWSSGIEVPGAKRPATISYPAPGRVNTNTPIVWRPVNNSIRIAN